MNDAEMLAKLEAGAMVKTYPSLRDSFLVATRFLGECEVKWPDLSYTWKVKDDKIKAIRLWGELCWYYTNQPPALTPEAIEKWAKEKGQKFSCRVEPYTPGMFYTLAEEIWHDATHVTFEGGNSFNVLRAPAVEPGSVWEHVDDATAFAVIRSVHENTIIVDRFGVNGADFWARQQFPLFWKLVPPERIVEHDGRRWVKIAHRKPKKGEWYWNTPFNKPIVASFDFDADECDILLPLFSAPVTPPEITTTAQLAELMGDGKGWREGCHDVEDLYKPDWTPRVKLPIRRKWDGWVTMIDNHDPCQNFWFFKIAKGNCQVTTVELLRDFEPVEE